MSYDKMYANKTTVLLQITLNIFLNILLIILKDKNTSHSLEAFNLNQFT